MPWLLIINTLTNVLAELFFESVCIILYFGAKIEHFSESPNFFAILFAYVANDSVTDDRMTLRTVGMLDDRVYNNYIIIGFIFVGMRWLIVILSSVIVMGDDEIMRRLTDFHRLRRGEFWLWRENFVPLHCQQRGRLRAAIKEKNCEN